MPAIASIAHTPEIATQEAVDGNYFVAVYPPFSAWGSSQCSALMSALERPVSDAPVGIYVHVPFCQKKCDFCYYLSYVGQSAKVVDCYLDCLARELRTYSSFPALNDRPISFVYFGGGTPSTLSNGQLHRLSAGLKEAMPWRGIEEVTFECASRSVRSSFLDALKDLGVTRLSMGVQSFDDHLLKLNGRLHLAEDVLRAYRKIRRFDFDWVNLDLMVGLMGETWDSWAISVQCMIDLAPESVTIYQTEVPYNTQLYRDFKDGRLPAEPIPWESKRERLAYGFNELEKAGYTIVNGYAAVKCPDRHRFIYQDHLWRGGDMLGLGVASFGYLGGVHYQNAASLEAYQAGVEEGGAPIQRAYALSDRDRLIREFILQLKFGEIAIPAFQRKFDVDILRVFERQLRELAAEGLATVSNSTVQLTRNGLLRVDRLLPRFYSQAYREARYT